MNKEGIMRSEKGNGEPVVFIDNVSILDSSENRQPHTLRRVDCDLLCEPQGRYPLQCRPCISIIPVNIVILSFSTKLYSKSNHVIVTQSTPLLHTPRKT